MDNNNQPVVKFTRDIADCSPASVFTALESLCQSLVGHRLFSCSVFDLNNGVARRVYTSDEVNYPVTGMKEIVTNRWTGIVFDDRKTFVANSVTEFSDVFPDHEKIAELGLGAVVNLPVFLCSRLLGTVNMLHEAEYYSNSRVALTRELLLPATIAFQLAEQHTT